MARASTILLCAAVLCVACEDEPSRSKPVVPDMSDAQPAPTSTTKRTSADDRTGGPTGGSRHPRTTAAGVLLDAGNDE